MVERGTHKPKVAGSIPAIGTRSKALVVFKKSAYQLFVLESEPSLFHPGKGPDDKRYLSRFRASHELQKRTLHVVTDALRREGVLFRTIFRAEDIHYDPYGLIITVGGDGTFLEAARHTKHQPIIGVNSDPKQSVGKFCSADAGSFAGLLSRFLRDRACLTRLPRLCLSLNGKPVDKPVLNEVLISHRNPAAMSRYMLSVGRVKEEHRSSGLWVSTAAGSTAAMRSAGGRTLQWASELLEYRPRELYLGHHARYRLRGGVLTRRTTLRVGSLMREGSVYLDGPHHSIPLHYGSVLDISLNAPPLNRIG